MGERAFPGFVCLVPLSAPHRTRLKSLTLTSSRCLRASRDVWSQLPADIFFEQLNAYPERPSVIIGAEKNCWPGPKTGPRCASLPESPLPKDIYGDLTDREQPHVSSQFDPAPPSGILSNYTYNGLETMRPRYINSGSESKV